MPHSVQITDSDVRAVEEAFACDFSHPNRRQAMHVNSTCDVQAGPGSGKTTLLVAKLVILASKWNWPDQGICVLSHTNAARNEVERRLVRHPTAHRLLGYPHFVGTIQVFVDQYLGIPFLKNKAIDVSMIDNEQFALNAMKELRRYYKANAFLSRRQDKGDIVAGLRYEYCDSGLKLGCAGKQLPVGQDTPTYKELVALKKKTGLNGFFRFDDMFAFAEAFVEAHPWIIHALRIRFPWVFVDEMQDTDSTQDRLLERLFGQGVTLQRFGDINQGIFHGEYETVGQNSFPRQGCIELGESKRFGESIARFASCLTAERQQTLVGRKDLKQPAHTIFLFDDASIHGVLPSFGDLLIRYYDGAFPKGSTVKAIGFRRSGSDEKKTPYTIADYWDGYVKEARPKTDRPKYLIDFVRKARHSREQSQECADAYNLVLDGVLHFLREKQIYDSAAMGFTKRSLKDTLLKLGNRDGFDALVARLCLPSKDLSRDSWYLCVNQLKEVVRCLMDSKSIFDNDELLQWRELTGRKEIPAEAKATDRINVYRHQMGRESVNIEVATIHSVKGQTHTATLILETYFNKTYDLKHLLPFLKGKGDRMRVDTEKSLKDHMKRIFVAMTRPTDLVCLAIHKDHLGPGDEKDLESFGWNIVNLAVRTENSVRRT
jgi:DNA helicase II / ATP-dependent DNA helicase PcrA